MRVGEMVFAGFAAGLLLAALPALVGLAQAQQAKPNIMLIVADDLGYGEPAPMAGAMGVACQRPASTASRTKE
jgi:hypothetical protein